MKKLFCIVHPNNCLKIIDPYIYTREAHAREVITTCHDNKGHVARWPLIGIDDETTD